MRSGEIWGGIRDVRLQRGYARGTPGELPPTMRMRYQPKQIRTRLFLGRFYAAIFTVLWTVSEAKGVDLVVVCYCDILGEDGT